MKEEKFHVNQRVFYTDPNGGWENSFGYITAIYGDLYTVTKDNGAEVEAYADNLESVKRK